MTKFEVPVTFEVTVYPDVKANTREEAMEIALKEAKRIWSIWMRSGIQADVEAFEVAEDYIYEVATP